MKKLFFVAVLSCRLKAGPILVVPGLHPGSDVQLPPDQSNRTGVTVEELAKQFPTKRFSFEHQDGNSVDNQIRNLFYYHDLWNPNKWVIKTTAATSWVPEEPSNFSVPPYKPPVCERDCDPPPSECELTDSCEPPPSGCELTNSCEPPPQCIGVECEPPPPSCEDLGTCNPPPGGCTNPGGCDPPPGKVPEPAALLLMMSGLLSFIGVRSVYKRQK